MANRSSNQSNTKSSEKDLWRTHPQAVKDASFLIGLWFGLDACATSMDIAIDGAYRAITPDMDALSSVELWKSGIGATWCNPPFSRKKEFIDMAYGATRKLHGQNVLLMLPYEPSTAWMRNAWQRPGAVLFEPDGRYSYLKPDGSTAGSAEFPSCFLWYTPGNFNPVRIPFERGCGGKL